VDLGQSSEEGLVCLVICLFHHMVVEIPLPGSDKEPAEQSFSVGPPKVKLGIHFCRPPASASPRSAGYQEQREGSRGFLEPAAGELILEEHCGGHSCTEELLLVDLLGEWNGSQVDLPESARPGVDLFGQVFLSLVCCHHVCFEL